MRHLIKLKTAFAAALLLLLLLGQTLNAQVQSPRYISMTPNTNGFYEYLPQAYNTNETYPLMIFIHGLGELGNGTSQLPSVLQNGPPRLINQGTFPVSFTVNSQTYKFIVISPQFIGWPTALDINNIITYATQNYSVNINKIYVTGLSMGGGATWEYAANQPLYANRLAAIVPVCGASWPDYGRARVIATANLPVWATHNTGDPTVPVSYTNDYITNINTAPAPIPAAKKTIFQSNSHDAWSTTYNPSFRENGMNVYEWMLQYQRNFGGTNQLPIAMAGSDVNISLPSNSTQFNGSNSWDIDGRITGYSWQRVSGPTQHTINNSAVSNPIISNLVAGSYVFRLTVTDNQGGTATDDITIRVNPIQNIPGRIEAENYYDMLGINTEGTGDAGGGLNVGYIDNGDWMDYNTNVAVAGTYTVNFRVSAPSAGAQLQLKKSDGSVLATLIVAQTGGWQTWTTITASVSLPAGNQVLRVYSNNTIQWNFNWMEFISTSPLPNQPPVANAGVNQTITLPANSVSLNGTGSTDDHAIVAYQWTKITGTGGTLTSPTAATTNFTGLTAGVYTIELRVTDDSSAIARDTVQITVNNPNNPPNAAPIANAGVNQTITLPANSVSLNGTGSTDDHAIVAYQWTKITGAGGTLTSPTAATTNFTGLTAGVYTVELRVTDDSSAIARDTVQITVNNPVVSGKTIPGRIEAEAYNNQSGTGLENCSEGGQNVAYLDNGDWMDYNVNVTAAGTYTANFRVASPNAGTQLQVRIGSTVLLTITVPKTNGWQTWTTVSGTITLPAGNQTLRIHSLSYGWNFNWMEFISTSPLPNQPPVANAGVNQTITLPANSVSLNGTGSTDDHAIVAYQWTKITGTGGTLTSPTAATTNFTGLTAGVYTIELRVTDDSSAIARDTVQITVNNPNNPPNAAPIANAGVNQTITLPANSVSLNGTGSTDDHAIVAYQWTKITGAGGTLTSPTAATTNFTGLTAGVYTVELRVTDDSSAIARDTVQITVNNPNNPPNAAPIANAGVNQTITLPANSVSLNGTGSTDDHAIVAYQWTKITGAGGTLTSPTAATTNFTGLTAGVYTVELRVTDDSSAIARDTVQITVNNPVVSGKTIPGRIEAEAYNNQSGTGLENCSEGGQNVAYLDNGDWMDYNVNVTAAGTYTANFRVASPNAGTQLQVRIGSTVLLTITVPKTNGWQTWTTVSGTITLPAGNQTLRIHSLAYGWNFNWMEFDNMIASRSNSPDEIITTVNSALAESLTTASLNIFPNPVLDQFELLINNDYAGIMSVQIFDLNGSLRKQGQYTKTKGLNRINLSVAGLSSGTYVIKLQMGDKKNSIRMIKL